jgi:hypothetical protein
MVVLVCGGRTYDDAVSVSNVLDKLHITRLVHGGARGADTIADNYAATRGIERRAYKIRRPRENGFQRNQRMLDAESPHLVVAFPGGNGTADMVRRARRAGIPVIEVK